MTLSLFPLLLIIILVIMSMMGSSKQFLLFGTVYGLIPLTGIGFLVLVLTVTQDEIGDGYLRPEAGRDDIVVRERLDVVNLGLIERYTGDHGVFDKIKRRERSYELVEIARKPICSSAITPESYSCSRSHCRSSRSYSRSCGVSPR